MRNPPGVKHRETGRAREALTIYLGMGAQRSLDKLAHRLTELWPVVPSLNTLKNWSSWYAWQKRAPEYDREVAEKVKVQIQDRRAAEIVKREELRLVNTALMAEMLHRYLILLDPNGVPVLDDEGHEQPRRFEHLDPKAVMAAIKMFEAGAKHERLDLGQVTDRPDYGPTDPSFVLKVRSTDELELEIRETLSRLVPLLQKNARENTESDEEDEEG